MPMLRFTLSALAIILVSTSTQAQTAVMKPGTGAVSGRVVLKDEPARDVAVVLQMQVSGASSNPDAVLRARTDGAGRFQFTGVAAGRYSIMAFAPGAISAGETNLRRPSGKTLNVSEGENIENIDLELKLGGVITGRVTDSGGRPLVDEPISLNQLNRDGRSQQVFLPFEMNSSTDDRGMYRIYGLPEGRYRVSVGYAQAQVSAGNVSGASFYPKTFHPDTTSESEAKVIEVTEGFEATNVDISVVETQKQKSYAISGRVVNAENGQPVAGVEIAYGSFRGGRMISSGLNGERSRANGDFRVMGFLPGQYGVFARSDDDDDFISDPVMFDINDGDIQGVEIKVRQAGTVNGVVVIEGSTDPKVLSRLSLVNLMFFLPMGSSRPIRVSADGSFRFRGLPPGIVQISAYGAPGLALARIELNGATRREGIEVKAGEQITGVKVVLTHGTLSLRGEVKLIGITLPQGQQLFAGARRVDQPTQSSSSADVDARGQFVIENLAPGEYEVRVSPSKGPWFDRPSGPGAQLMRAFEMAKLKVNLGGGDQAQITLVVDINNK